MGKWHQVFFEPWSNDEFGHALWAQMRGLYRAGTEWGSAYVRSETLSRLLALPGAGECIEEIINDIDEEEVRWEIKTRWLAIRDA